MPGGNKKQSRHGKSVNSGRNNRGRQVANVNNGGEVDLTAQNIQDDRIAQPRGHRGRSQKHGMQEPEPAQPIIRQNQDGTIHAEFMEGEAMIEMSVRHNDSFGISYDQLAAETSDEEREVHFSQRNDSQSTMTREDYDDDNEMQADENPASVQEVQGRSPGDADAQDDEPVAKIWKIDAEMWQKMKELHALMTKGGLDESAQMLQQCMEVYEPTDKGGHQQGRQENAGGSRNHEYCSANMTNNACLNSQSEVIIYERAIKNQGSTSSEGEMDTSDERISENQNNSLILAGRRHESVDRVSTLQDPLPSMSRDYGGRDRPAQLSPQEPAEKMVRDAECAKAQIFPPKGNQSTPVIDSRRDLFQFIAQMDEDYLVIGGHVDEALAAKIVNGEYVDFGKLIPKDRILTEEDGRMELVHQEGKTYWVPVSDTTSINNFSKWEQAFRIYANIYTRAHPQRSSELIQYNHVIHAVSLTYLWDNVYNYDKEFHMHLSRHPNQSWAVILQQAWSMRLKDKINRFESPSVSQNPNQFGSGGRGRSHEPCRRYNRGKCNFGAACKYEHCCTYCNKIGHGFFSCRRASADRDKGMRDAGGAAGTPNKGVHQAREQRSTKN